MSEPKSLEVESLPLDELLGIVKAVYPNGRSRVGKHVKEMARRLRLAEKRHKRRRRLVTSEEGECYEATPGCKDCEGAEWPCPTARALAGEPR